MRTNLNLQKRVLEHLQGSPGVCFDDVATALNIPQQAASGALSQLYAKRLLTRQRRGKCFVYILAEATKAQPVETAGDGAWKQRAAELQEKVDELYAWKLQAVAKYPDLQPLDPLLLKAREIVAKTCRERNSEQEANEVEAGEHDNKDLIEVAMAALRSCQ